MCPEGIVLHGEHPVSRERMFRTSVAAPYLGISQGHLKRQMDTKGGPLRAGIHYQLGPHRNSPILWDVDAVRDEFHRRGMLARKADAIITSIQG